MKTWQLALAAVPALAVGWLMRAPLQAAATAVLRYITNAERDARFGPLRFVPAPREGDPEAVRITNGFEQRLVKVDLPIVGPITIHELAAPSLYAALSEIEARGLAPLIRSFNGSYNPRFVRGSTTSLSSHAYATSIDINAGQNPRGAPPTAEQTELAPIFEKHGWYWGDRFRPTRDPMHFEFVGQA